MHDSIVVIHSISSVVHTRTVLAVAVRLNVLLSKLRASVLII